MIRSREELIKKLEKDSEDFYVNDGTMEDIEYLEKEHNYDYNKVYNSMMTLIDIMYSEE